MVAGTRAPPRRREAKTVKDPAVAKKKNARGFELQEDGSVKSVAVKSVDKIASQTLNAIQQKSLQVIVKVLTANPDRILMAEKIVQDPEYFVVKTVVKRKDWLHKTILTMAGYPKFELRPVLLKFASLQKGEQYKHWNEELLTKIDRKYNNRGIEKLAAYLGGYHGSFGIPTWCHYRPLMADALLEAFKGSPFAKGLAVDKAGGVNFQMYEFADEDNGRWTKIRNNLLEESVAIPEDFYVKVGSLTWSIIENHSFRDARLKGTSVDKYIMELFEDARIEIPDKNTWLDEEVKKHLGAHREKMQEELATMDVADRPERMES